MRKQKIIFAVILILSNPLLSRAWDRYLPAKKIDDRVIELLYRSTFMEMKYCPVKWRKSDAPV